LGEILHLPPASRLHPARAICHRLLPLKRAVSCSAMRIHTSSRCRSRWRSDDRGRSLNVSGGALDVGSCRLLAPLRAWLVARTWGSWCGFWSSWLGTLLWHQSAASSSLMRASGQRGAPRTPSLLRKPSRRRTSSAPPAASPGATPAWRASGGPLHFLICLCSRH
jgi:hypothetical protein